MGAQEQMANGTMDMYKSLAKWLLERIKRAEREEQVRNKKSQIEHIKKNINKLRRAPDKEDCAREMVYNAAHEARKNLADAAEKGYMTPEVEEKLQAEIEALTKYRTPKEACINAATLKTISKDIEQCKGDMMLENPDHTPKYEIDDPKRFGGILDRVEDYKLNAKSPEAMKAAKISGKEMSPFEKDLKEAVKKANKTMKKVEKREHKIEKKQDKLERIR